MADYVTGGSVNAGVQASVLATAGVGVPTVSTGNLMIDMLVQAMQKLSTNGTTAAAAAPAAPSSSETLAKRIENKDPELMRILTDYPQVVDANGNVDQGKAKKLGFSNADHATAYQIQIALESQQAGTQKGDLIKLAKNGELAGLIKKAGDDGLVVAGVGASIIINRNGNQTYNADELNKEAKTLGVKGVTNNNSQVDKGGTLIRLRAAAKAQGKDIGDIERFYNNDVKGTFNKVVGSPELMGILSDPGSNLTALGQFVGNGKLPPKPTPPAATPAPPAAAPVVGQSGALTTAGTSALNMPDITAQLKAIINAYLSQAGGGLNKTVGTFPTGAGMSMGGFMPTFFGAAGSNNFQATQGLGGNMFTQPAGNLFTSSLSAGGQLQTILGGIQGNDGGNLNLFNNQVPTAFGGGNAGGGFHNLSPAEMQALNVLNASGNVFSVQQK